ncbi:hypothetical protein BJY14_004230 [Actinomadura luteofluorescens]|uniref:Uncharacterized protein n=1 Tax=Actinomadura luteofluorescens TaxID=46163 RepID=A0A7Y9JGG3_9ACTN|nr:hypothetical protein [Actinomadura luteofluorescens]
MNERRSAPLQSRLALPATRPRLWELADNHTHPSH